MKLSGTQPDTSPIGVVRPGTQHRRLRQQGNVLLLGLVLTVVLFGATAALVSVSLTNAQAVEREVHQRSALYLAQGGLAASKEELGAHIDRNADGIGNTAYQGADGGYFVTATEFETARYLLDSLGTGLARQRARIHEVVERVPVTRFPNAAISVIGEVDKLKLTFKKHPGLLIDGGTLPALAIAHPLTHAELLADFGRAVRDGQLPAPNVLGNSGSPVSEAEGWSTWRERPEDSPIVLPIALVEVPDPAMIDMDPVYGDFLTGIQGLLPAAQVEGEKLGSGSDVFTFGTAGSPATVQFAQRVDLRGSDRISGHGTLIISNEFLLADDSALDWIGNVIVYADTMSKAKLLIDGGFDVTGNVLVLGEGMEDAEFVVRPGADARIDGSMFVGTVNATDRGKKARLEVDGQMHVTGMMSVMGGRKVEIRFTDTSHFVVDGMLQLSLGDFAKDDQLLLEFNGQVEILRSEAAMRSAARDLVDLAGTLDADVSALIAYEVITHSWARVPDDAEPVSPPEEP